MAQRHVCWEPCSMCRPVKAPAHTPHLAQCPHKRTPRSHVLLKSDLSSPHQDAAIAESLRTGKTPRLCEAGAPYRALLDSCRACIQANGTPAESSDYGPFEQSLEYCDRPIDQASSSPASKSASTSSSQLPSSSWTGPYTITTEYESRVVTYLGADNAAGFKLTTLYDTAVKTVPLINSTNSTATLSTPSRKFPMLRLCGHTDLTPRRTTATPAFIEHLLPTLQSLRPPAQHGSQGPLLGVSRHWL